MGLVCRRGRGDGHGDEGFDEPGGEPGARSGLARGDGGCGQGRKTHGDAAPAGDGGEFAGALHGFADVAEMVGGAGVNGDRRALRGAERTGDTHGLDYARVGDGCQVLCNIKFQAAGSLLREPG